MNALVATSLSASSLLRLFQLASAALPVGAFAYSQGLEQAVALGEVKDSASAADWICGMLERSLLTLDIPLFARMHAALARNDVAAAARWNEHLFAARGTAELRAEDRQVGSALARILAKQGVSAAEPWQSHPRATFAGSFALAAIAFEAPLAEAALAYVYAWSEAQVGAATRLVPLGQSSAQSVLSLLIERAARGLAPALARSDDRIASASVGQALLSTLHETQYSRLFRS